MAVSHAPKPSLVCSRRVWLMALCPLYGVLMNITKHRRAIREANSFDVIACPFQTSQAPRPRISRCSSGVTVEGIVFGLVELVRLCASRRCSFFLKCMYRLFAPILSIVIPDAAQRRSGIGEPRPIGDKNSSRSAFLAIDRGYFSITDQRPVAKAWP